MSRFVANNLQTTAKKENELSDIDTSKLHCVKVPANHIVIDFDHKVIDLTCALGEEVADYITNIETDNPGSGVALFRSENGKSKSGSHLHYIYTGNNKDLLGWIDTILKEIEE